MSENEPELMRTISDGPADDAAPDWAAIEIEVSPELPNGAGETGQDGEGLLTRDDFYQAVKAMFELPNVFLPVPIKSLPIADAEEPQARAATDAFYGIALKSPWLRVLLQPGAEWLQPIIAIGTFAFGKIAAVRLELAARGRPAANDNQRRPAAANDNAPGKTDGLGPFAHERA